MCNERALRGGEVGFLRVEFTSKVFVSGDAGEVVDLFYGLEGVSVRDVLRDGVGIDSTCRMAS